MNTKEEVLNDIAKEIYGKTYDDLRSVEQDEVYCIAEDSCCSSSSFYPPQIGKTRSSGV